MRTFAGFSSGRRGSSTVSPKFEHEVRRVVRIYSRHTSLRAASHRAIGYVQTSKSTSDQCDESDLLKFVQNQTRAK